MLMPAILFFIAAMVCGGLVFPVSGPVSLPVVGFFLLLLAADLCLLFAPPVLHSHRDLPGMSERRQLRVAWSQPWAVKVWLPM